MARYKVSYKMLSKQADELKAVAKLLDGYGERVKKIANGIQNVNMLSPIRNDLQKLSVQLVESRAVVNTAGEVLSKTTNKYTQVEKRQVKKVDALKAHNRDFYKNPVVVASVGGGVAAASAGVGSAAAAASSSSASVNVNINGAPAATAGAAAPAATPAAETTAAPAAAPTPEAVPAERTSSHFSAPAATAAPAAAAAPSAPAEPSAAPSAEPIISSGTPSSGGVEPGAAAGITAGVGAIGGAAGAGAVASAQFLKKKRKSGEEAVAEVNADALDEDDPERRLAEARERMRQLEEDNDSSEASEEL